MSTLGIEMGCLRSPHAPRKEFALQLHQQVFLLSPPCPKIHPSCPHFSSSSSSFSWSSFFIDRTARIWDVESSICRYNYSGHKGAVNSIRFHPTDPLVCTGGPGSFFPNSSRLISLVFESPQPREIAPFTSGRSPPSCGTILTKSHRSERSLRSSGTRRVGSEKMIVQEVPGQRSR